MPHTKHAGKSIGLDSTAAEVPSDTLELTGVHLTAYKQIVRPNQVVKLESYFLERWVRLLGPSAAWMVVAFRQEAYLNKAFGSWIKVSGRQIAQWVSLNPDTFWRHLREPGLLSWFIERDEGKPLWMKGANGRPHRDLNRYRVQQDTPLTPADQAHLRRWLTAHAPSSDAKGMMAALTQALETNRKDLLAPDPAAPAPRETRPLSVHDIARQAAPKAHYGGEVLEFFSSLCDDLHERLIPSDAQLVFITHYFIREWLPQLGHDLAWLIVYLQDQVFLDEAQSIQRDTFWVEGGVRRLADIIGLAQSKTVGNWLSGSEEKRQDRTQDRRVLVARFASVLARKKGRDKAEPQRVDVQVWARPAMRVPLTPEDHKRWSEMIESLAGAGDEEGRGRGEGRGVYPTHSRQGQGVHPIHSEQGQGVDPIHGKTGEGAGPRHSRGGEGVHPRDEGGGSGRSSESLSSLINSQRENAAPPQPQAPAGAPEGAVGVVGMASEEGWGDLKSLTQQGQIPSKGNITRRQLLAADPHPRIYVAWYLAGLTQDSIKWPAIWAAGKCIEADEDEMPPDLFIRVAAHGPEETARLLRWVARWPNSNAWELPDAEAYDRAREFIQACGDMAAGWKAEKDRYVTLNSRMQRGIRELGLTARVQAQEEAEAHARQAPPDEEEAQPEISEEPVVPDPVLDVPYENTGKTLRQIWQDVLQQLQLEMPRATFDTWVKGLELVTHEERMFVVGVPNAYAKDWLENRLLKTVKRTLSGIVGKEGEVRFEAKSKAEI